MSYLDGTTVLDRQGLELARGDALRVLARLKENSVDLVLADPPYSSGGQYRGDRAQATSTKYVSTDSAHQSIADFTGDNRDQRAYLTWSTLWLGEAHRALKPGRIACVFTDWRQLPTTTDALQAGGFVWRGIGTWDKVGGRPAPGIATGRTEFIVWGTKGPIDLGHEVYLPSILRHGIPRTERLHQTPKPVDLLAELVKLAPPGGLVVDPFTGSGSVLVAARRMGRRALGIELAEEHLQTATDRVASTAAQTMLTLDPLDPLDPLDLTPPA